MIVEYVNIFIEENNIRYIVNPWNKSAGANHLDSFNQESKVKIFDENKCKLENKNYNDIMNFKNGYCSCHGSEERQELIKPNTEINIIIQIRTKIDSSYFNPTIFLVTEN